MSWIANLQFSSVPSGMLKNPSECFVEMHIGGDDPLETFRKVLQMYSISFSQKSSLSQWMASLYWQLSGQNLTPCCIPFTLTSNLWPDPLDSILNVFLESNLSSLSALLHSFHLCSSIPEFSTPLYSQHSSLSRSAEMEDLSCQLLARNCPLAMHLIQHKSLNPFCLKGPDPVLVFTLLTPLQPCWSPHDSHTPGLFILKDPAASPSLLEGSSPEPPDPVAPLLPSCIIEAILTPLPLLPHLLYNFIFYPQHFSLYGMLIIWIIYLFIRPPLTEV